MKICIIGAGHMGTWLVEEFCHDHEVAVYDLDKNKMKYFYNVKRMMDLSEIKDFAPDMLINAVELDITIKVFESVLEFLPQNCILCDITAVKTGMKDFYSKNKFRNFLILYCSDKIQKKGVTAVFIRNRLNSC